MAELTPEEIAEKYCLSPLETEVLNQRLQQLARSGLTAAEAQELFTGMKGKRQHGIFPSAASHTHWVINVGGGYGAFLLEGSEAEAEEIRRHKANWEQAIALKRPATESEIQADTPSNCWNHPEFPHRKKGSRYSCDCGDVDCLRLQEDNE